MATAPRQGRSVRPASRSAAGAIALALALGSGGCGSVLARWFADTTHPEDRFQGPFRGVRLDVDLLGALAGYDASVLMLGPLLVLDLPLSFVLDLVCLPYDAYPSSPAPHPPAAGSTPPTAIASDEAPAWTEATFAAQLLGPDSLGLWDELHGKGDAGLASASPSAGPEVTVLPPTPGGLRLVAFGGLRSTPARGQAPPSVVGAAIDHRGDALVGHGLTVLEHWRRALDAPAPVGRQHPLYSGARVLAVARARTGRALVGMPERAVLLEPSRPASRGVRASPGRSFHLDGPSLAASAAITPGGERGAVGSVGGEVAVWELGGAGAELHRLPPWRTLHGPGRAWAACLAFEGDDVLWVGHADGSVVRWLLPPDDEATAEPRGRDPGAVLALAVGPDGVVVTAGASELVTIRRPDGSTGAIQLHGLEPGQHVVALALAPDGRELVVGALDGVVRRIELATGRELDRIDLRPIEDRPRAVALLDGAVTVVTERGTLLRYAKSP